jgi:phage head maturation protease
VDEKGVNFEFEAPKCDIGDRCLEMVRRGDYSGCSFEFWPEDYDVEERQDGKDVKITHKKFRALTALTIGMDPAYKQTSVNARELYDQTPSGIAEKKAEEEAKQREQEEKEEAMRKEMHRRAEHLRRLADFDEKLEKMMY